MTSRAETFDALYRSDPDPWRYVGSRYEREKYAATLAALLRPRYAAALEIGCSIGVMTGQLASRCRHVTAVDVSAVALEHCRARCAGLPVTTVEAEIPDGWPHGRFDLIVLSEVLYFLSAGEVERCAGLAAENLDAAGEILLVNWLGESDTAVSGDAAAELFIATAAPALVHAAVARTDLYRIDRLTPAR